ncbi:CCCH zinc finger DNA binding protein [Madurella fahalii]|uniref:CCCH zinc finger DNA binding protein n=1 Tax=Madurella fahalii TaxID=1157608 RepID=A0ABQ0GJJ6_9PEZI
MLNDREIDRAAAQLAEFRRTDALSELLNQHEVLIESYRRLKSDYEEEREAREKYKQMAKDRERKPFVLVLVDGDGYIFNDSLIAKRAEGGSSAAQMLNDEVKASLRRKGLEHCQVMVRIYANVAGLSRALSKAGLSGNESRSLAPFIASFNRSYGLTEFVDAGQLKENADFKLRALLHLYAESAQCKHIYFAACHDVGYISELMPFVGNSAKFTLVNSPGIRFHDEFTKLGMGIEEFRGVFRHAPLDGSAPYWPLATAAVNAKTPTVPSIQNLKQLALCSATPGAPDAPSPASSPVKPGWGVALTTANDEQKPVCLFNALGKCRYGKNCKHLHRDLQLGATNGLPQYADLPSPPRSSTSVAPPHALDRLPRKKEIPPGTIAVNKANYRLDAYLPPVSAETIGRLKARVDKKRVCNSFHLNGYCDAGDRCEYDHEPLEEEFLPALESLARSQPCPRRGGCRLETCTHGHICQCKECKHRGGKVYCKLPYLAHLEDLDVADFVPSVCKSGGKSSTSNGCSETSTTSG